MTSQWFAVFYLDKMDKYIRETIKIPFYTRYMDDFVLIAKDKAFLKETLVKLKAFLQNELKLELNEKTQIFPAKNGVDYLGFHTYITGNGKVIRKLRRRSKRSMKNKIRHFNEAYSERLITYDAVKRSLASWLGHAKHGNTYYLRTNILKKLKLGGKKKR